MKYTPSTLLVFALFVAMHPTTAQSIDAKISTELDEIFNNQFPAGGSGAAVLIAQKGKIVYHKAAGMANLELEVPMKTDHVFRIGSVTKQFTAAAILLLAEQGKLTLQDDLTKFLPDYPTKGKKITVEQLLNHTSGIKSYTNMPEWDGMMRRKDFTVEALIDLFKDQPMEFEPGAAWNYNNSGYILLGAIIEKVSGQTYAEFIDSKFFKPLGMKNSYYGDVLPVIKNRVTGYSSGNEPGTFVNCEYLSMTQPYAAGSLLSTVEDLFIWTKAVHSGKVLKPESLKKAFTAHILPNGSNTNYGYGWQIGNLLGSRTIEHGGGINGFLSTLVYLPDEDVCVAMLSNCDCNSPDEAAAKMAGALLGKPFQPKAIKVNAADLEQYVGVYENDKNEQRVITSEAGQLYSQRSGGSKFKLMPFATDQFFFENSFARIVFVHDSKGAKKGNIAKAIVSDRNTSENLWVKTGKPLPVARQEIQLSEAELQKFTGEYELMQGFTITVTREGQRLFCQATGQPQFEVFSESPTRFFLKVVDAAIEFYADEQGVVSKMTLFQGGQQLPGKRIK